MRTLRAVIYYVVALTSVVIPALLVVLLWPFLSAKVRFEKIGIPWFKLSIWLCEKICGLGYVVKGEENIPDKNARLLVFCKHQSAWETMFLPAYLPNRIGYVYKKSLHWIPFLGWAIKSTNMVGIDRSNGRRAYEDLMRKGKDFLDRGWWMAIFPEGTRVAPGKRVPYKTGGARFAVAAGADILPIALNSGEFWPKNSLSKNPGTITVSIGPVISTKGKTHEEVNALAEKWIEEEMKRISAKGLYD